MKADEERNSIKSKYLELEELGIIAISHFNPIQR